MSLRLVEQEAPPSTGFMLVDFSSGMYRTSITEGGNTREGPGFSHYDDADRHALTMGYEMELTINAARHYATDMRRPPKR